MEKQVIQKDDYNDPEFEMWLRDQLKQTMVEPSENLSQRIMAKLDKSIDKSQTDPILLIVLVVLLMLCSCIMVFLSVFPELWRGITAKILVLDTGIDYRSLVHIITGVVVIGILFFRLDNLLNKKVGKQKILLTF
jgi:hypothetical protein